MNLPKLKSRQSVLAAFLMAASLAACGAQDEPAQKDTPAAGVPERSAYMAKNVERARVQETESGLQYEILEVGTGEMPGATSEVIVHYTGTLTDGTVFDSSVKRGEPAQFPLNRVIAGWTEGLQLMREGSKYKFFIPPHLGYGAQGAPGAIPPNADLIFEVELLKVIVDTAEPHPLVTAFLERPVPAPTCGAAPVSSGGESAEELAELHAKGNAWQNCMASFIKDTMQDTQQALGQLQQIESSQVPAEQRDQVNAFLQQVSISMDESQKALDAFKGIAKA